MSTVDRIKERLNIVDVVSSYLKLDRAGVNLKARCPFHNEKTPSFFVSPERDTYHCFGCDKGGDIFSFIQEIEGVDFRESLHILAERAGVPVESVDRGERDAKKRLYECMEAATIYFEKELTKDEAAKKYLTERGLTPETVRSFRIGFSPQEWRALSPALFREGFIESDLAKVGLIIAPERGGSPYDRFRGRIMFPIADSQGRVVAFSGRISPYHVAKDDTVSAGAKYVNSPETPLFSKSKILYAYDKAKSHIRENNFCIVVEGQIDVILSHQAGFKNAVAVSGTALTNDHLALLNRMTENLILAFDADTAGLHASERGVPAALSQGFTVRILKLPPDSDPADVILKDAKAWETLVKESKHVVDFYLSVLREAVGDTRELGKRIEKEALPYVARVKSTLERAHFVSRISAMLGTPEEPIWESLKKIEASFRTPYRENSEKQKKEWLPPSHEARFRKLEERLLGLLLWQRKAEEKNAIIKEIEDFFRELPGETLTERLEKLSQQESEKILFEAEAYYKDSHSLGNEAEELLGNFKEHVLHGRLLQAMDELKLAEKDNDEKRAEACLLLCKTLSEDINKLTSLRMSEKM